MRAGTEVAVVFFCTLIGHVYTLKKIVWKSTPTCLFVLGRGAMLGVVLSVAEMLLLLFTLFFHGPDKIGSLHWSAIGQQ